MFKSCNDLKKMGSKLGDGIFEIVCLIDNINIKLSARCESGVKQILALVTNNNDIVLHYIFGKLNPVLKRVPWFADSVKTIQGICFDPSATWLLVVCLDCSLYIIPALSLVDKKQRVDCKWSLTDITHFPKRSQIPQAIPTSLVWWQTLDTNQNALVGFENGAIVLISLTDGRYLGSCTISESVQALVLCQDNKPDTVSLLINGIGGQQWRLVLEHRPSGYLWPPEINNQNQDSTRSRLISLKQLGVDKLVSFKQRFSEARGGRRDSQTSDTTSDSSHSESIQLGPEMLPHLCDTFFSQQITKNRYLFCAFYKPTSLLTVHTLDVESAPLYVYKLPQKCDEVILTDKVIYALHAEDNTVSVLSTYFTECRLEGDSEFNSEALLAQFHIDGGNIQQLYKISDVLAHHRGKGPLNTNRLPSVLPKTVDECVFERPVIDTCVIIANNAVYRISLRESPVYKFMRSILETDEIEVAEKIADVFKLNMIRLLELCGDILLANGSFHSGLILYKQAKVHLLKRVLRLAISADCKTLLKFIHLCLSASKVDMSVATKIHIGNLAVMAYTELILRYSGQQRILNTRDFMNFLCSEEYYDQVLAVNIACQAGHWNIVTLLARSRGLQPEVVSALGQILQSARAPNSSDREFLNTVSEPSLAQSLLISGQTSQVIFRFIRTNVEAFPVEILRRFAVQLDPSQPSILPLASKLFQNRKFSSSLDTTIESVDLDNSDRSTVVMKDVIDTFICVVICLTSRTDKIRFNIDLLHTVEPPESASSQHPLKKLPNLKPLSCGFEHASIIRNYNVYTMGASTSGCLGLGPLLATSSPPKLVQVLSDVKVKALSVGCGRKHTLVLTDFGVYTWGSNTYGQLGLGSHVVDSPYPQMLTFLSALKIIEIATGQYHSLALTTLGKVYTWGWGIHGQLGHGTCDNKFYPKLLNFPDPVRQIAAGHAHSLMLTEEGKLYGFGSNIFGQLEGCQIDLNKSARPVWIVLKPDLYLPVEKVATSYFHSIAVNADQEVFVWGASPQELRIFQSKNNQKQDGISLKAPDAWKASVNIYSVTENSKPIEQVAVGYRHSVVLHNGHILWGKGKDEELSSPMLRKQDNIVAQRFMHVSCGLDYTMAIDQCGKLLAWGSSSMAQTLLGRPFSEENRRSEGKMAIFKNTKRVVRFPNSSQGTSEHYPLEVPGLPTMAITFNPSDQKLLLGRNTSPYSVFRIENENVSFETNTNHFEHIYGCPKFRFCQKTLHYILETYYGFYDLENILAKCLDVNNFQASAKISMLDGHFGDSLGFQLRALKKHLESLDLSPVLSKESPEKDVEFIVKSFQDDLNEKNLSNSNSQSPAHILSTSSSLDSIRQWGDDLEHQGGCESPCDIGDVRQNITQYVQSLRQGNENSPPISSVSKMVAEIDNTEKKAKVVDKELPVRDKGLIEAIEVASSVVEFYIKKIYSSENHILMQNILMKCIEFWLANYLPVPVLEGILLKNMDKYFYPLSVLLFCKDFGDSGQSSPKKPAPGFLKEFSTKFCLQLCSMVLDNVNKS